jgi:putative membrane protein
MPDPFQIGGDTGTDLAARRTGLAFQRTRMAADRTMMAVIRTSLSLISFGFTIYKLIQGAQASKLVVLNDHASRNFGLTLIGIGIAALVAGIIYQLRFMMQLRAQRSALEREGSIHAESDFPSSFNLVLAVLLLLVGVFAIVSIVFRTGPFI